MQVTLRERVSRANKKLYEDDLVKFTWGNASAIDRQSHIIFIKPSGVSYESLVPANMVAVLFPENVVAVNLNPDREGIKLRPSSDTPTHLELYRNFSGIEAVVHTHSLYATVCAQARVPIRCVGTTHADHFYGTIPITRELSHAEIETDYEKNVGKLIVETFKNQDPLEIPACLIAGHGPFAWGRTIEEAVEHAFLVELVAKLFVETSRLNPAGIVELDRVLLEKHYTRKHGSNKYYGQP